LPPLGASRRSTCPIPTLDVVLAEQVVEEQEGDLLADRKGCLREGVMPEPDVDAPPRLVPRADRAHVAEGEAPPADLEDVAAG
jgi:hypothetical protein